MNKRIEDAEKCLDTMIEGFERDLLYLSNRVARVKKAKEILMRVVKAEGVS